ncbi:serine hydrolase domain-containing protein [Limibacter armeniacum]|uniref:serine hydrolase domain-containing protein n=1 Tax=Limibacter armeniacum TaxID=466084 RepID=UPI002FE546B2
MKLIISVTLLLLAMNVSAQNFDRQKMDSLFSLIDKKQKGMGSVSLFMNGEEVYQKSIGFADVENKILADKDTKYRVGSVTKMFTASMIIQLVEEGKISLDTTLDQFFPAINHADKITIRHLLTHQSGIFNFTNAADYTQWMEQPISQEKLLEKIIANGSVFEPGEKSEYSNSNYVLLSFIAEKLDKKPYAKILEDRICKPLQLKATAYGDQIESSKNEALSYHKAANWVKATETDMSVPIGAGALVSTPNDLNRFLNAFYNSKLFSTSSLSSMMKIKDSFGMGMFQAPFYEKKAFGHTGGVDGFQSFAFYFPDEKVSIAYTSNGVLYPVNDIIIGVLSIYFEKDYQFPDFTEIKINEEELKQYTGVYASEGLPIKITITQHDNQLIGQATGQPPFPLEPITNNSFKFEQAKVVMDFNPDDKTMILKQGGQEYKFSQE